MNNDIDISMAGSSSVISFNAVQVGATLTWPKYVLCMYFNCRIKYKKLSKYI